MLPTVTRQYSPEDIDIPGYLPDITEVRKEIAQYYGSVYRADQSIGAVLDALKKAEWQKIPSLYF